MTRPTSDSSSSGDQKWTWLGKATRRNNCTRYEQVRFTRSRDNRERVFETGHCVIVASTDHQLWVAQIIELYQVGVDLEDEEVQVVAETTPQQMRCKLRWFYRANDATLINSRRVSPQIPMSVRNELYFSDHIEDGSSNSVEVIEGRAFPCSTQEQIVQFRSDLPKEYWEGDAVCLVRCFYGYNSGSPPPIRELRKGELEAFLRHPSSAPDLYNISKVILYGRHGAIMKGTGRKRKFQSLPTPYMDTSEVTERYRIQKNRHEPDALKDSKPVSSPPNLSRVFSTDKRADVSRKSKRIVRRVLTSESPPKATSSSRGIEGIARDTIKPLSINEALSLEQFQNEQDEASGVFPQGNEKPEEPNPKARFYRIGAGKRLWSQRKIKEDEDENGEGKEEQNEVERAWGHFKEIAGCGSEELQKNFFENFSKILRDFMNEIRDRNINTDMEGFAVEGESESGREEAA